MATVLDTGLLRFFIPIVSFLLVFSVSYALLQKTNILHSRSVNLAAAFAISLLFLFVPDASKLLEVTLPWIVVFLIFAALIFATFMFLGVKENQMNEVLAMPTVYWTIIVIMLGIFLFGLMQIFGEQVQAVFGGGDSEVEDNIAIDVGKVIFHPRVLGAIIILLVASQAIRLIVPRAKEVK